MKRLVDLVRAACFLALLALVALKLAGGQQSLYTGSARVVDGDTLVMAGERLRLAGIDAPELHQICKTGEADWQCGLAARDQLDQMVQMPGLECRTTKRDKWRRPLVNCEAGDLAINREMVLTGMAVDYGQFEAEANEARTQKRGIWASSFERPETWRKNRKKAEADGMDEHDGPDGWFATITGWFGL